LRLMRATPGPHGPQRATTARLRAAAQVSTHYPSKFASVGTIASFRCKLRNQAPVFCHRANFTCSVIPDLIRNPVFFQTGCHTCSGNFRAVIILFSRISVFSSVVVATVVLLVTYEKELTDCPGYEIYLSIISRIGTIQVRDSQRKHGT
jgi:hypothetical protein